MTKKKKKNEKKRSNKGLEYEIMKIMEKFFKEYFDKPEEERSPFG